MDAERIINGKIFDVWKKDYPLLFNETNPNLSLKNNQKRNCASKRQAQFQLDGYFHEINGVKKFSSEIQQMADFLEYLVIENYSPAFLFATEAPWKLFESLSDLFQETLGSSFGWIPAFWAWYVDPKKKDSGWNTHRDRPRSSLFDDGSPKCLTCWIPLTESSPSNGCIYVVPKQYDNSYGVNPDSVLSIQGYPAIRALPGMPGDAFVWDQTLLHWGARSSEFCERPRLSMALELQRIDIPALQQIVLPSNATPCEADRMRLIGMQILQYEHMYPLNDLTKETAKKIMNYS